MDHCMFALRQMHKDLIFRSYIADGMYALVNHTGQAFSDRFIDLVLPKNEDASEDEDNIEKARKIKDKLMKKLGGTDL